MKVIGQTVLDINESDLVLDMNESDWETGSGYK